MWYKGCSSNCLKCSSTTACTLCAESSKYYISESTNLCVYCLNVDGTYISSDYCKSKILSLFYI